MMRTLRLILKCVLAVFFILAGINHFLNPAFYLKIMPPYLPWHLFLVYLSGLCEIALGAMLMIPRAARAAAWGMILLLIAFLPVHFHMAFHPDLYPEYHPLALWARLPVQGLLMLWAWWYTGRRPGGERESRRAAAA